MKFGAWAHDPLENKLSNINCPILFLYGDEDWMTKSVPSKLISENKLFKGSNIKIIKKSGHQPHIDNPFDFTGKIIEWVLGFEEKQ